MNKKWTDVEKNYIANHANTMTDEELARQISALRLSTVSKDCVRKMRQRMGLKKKHGRGVCQLQEKDNEV